MQDFERGLVDFDGLRLEEMDKAGFAHYQLLRRLP
jgi:hypothetical protein